MSAADWLLLLGLSLLWGGSFFFAKIAVLELPPMTVALGRVAIAAAILLTLARATGVALPASLPDWWPFALMGLLNNVLPFTLLFWGQTHIPSGLAAILNATTPLFTVLVAHVATADEKLTGARLAGLAAGLAGVVVMIGPDVLRDLGANVLAQLACLLAAISYAFAGVYGRRFRGEPTLRVGSWHFRPGDPVPRSGDGDAPTRSTGHPKLISLRSPLCAFSHLTLSQPR